MSDIKKIWFNGEMRDSADCHVHVLSHALHYGSSTFEGIRAYEGPDGPVIFRGREHYERALRASNRMTEREALSIRMLYEADLGHREAAADLFTAYLRSLQPDPHLTFVAFQRHECSAVEHKGHADLVVRVAGRRWPRTTRAFSRSARR
jgi:branched-subunit amino acid aminotransferase/4-amino-4-deoxychorismate lyase